MNRVYKITDRHNQTRRGTQWGEGVRHTSNDLFGDSNFSMEAMYLYSFRTAELATLFAPVHLEHFDGFRLWEAKGEIKEIDSTTAKCDSIQTIREIPFPKIDVFTRIVFCLFITLKIFKNDVWRAWALSLLLNNDGTQHRWEAAKSAAESIGTTADLEAQNAELQYVNKLKMFRDPMPFGSGLSPISKMPLNQQVEEEWKMSVAYDAAQVTSLQAQTACWACEVVSTFRKATQRDINIVNQILYGNRKLAQDGVFEKLKSLSRWSMIADKLSRQIVECLGWAEKAVKQKQIAEANKAEYTNMEQWRKIKDDKQRGAARDKLRFREFNKYHIDFHEIYEFAKNRYVDRVT